MEMELYFKPSISATKQLNLCDDCLHKDICKIKEEVRVYALKVLAISSDLRTGPLSAITLDIHCASKLTAPIVRGGGDAGIGRR